MSNTERKRTVFRIAVLVASMLFLTVASQAVARELATVSVHGGSVMWSPQVSHGGLVLTVSGGDFSTRLEFDSGESPSFDPVDADGQPLPDGTYTWELAVVVARRELRAAGNSNAQMSDNGRATTAAQTPKGLVQSGSFTIAGGSIADPNVTEHEPVAAGRGTRIAGDLMASGTKNFVVVDPADSDRAIVFAALEGPEAGTYYRGAARTVDGEAVIELPSYFAKVTEAEGLTVQITPMGGFSQLYVVDVSPRRLVVRDANSGDGVQFSFLVQGVRAGYADYQVERSAEDIGRSHKQ